MSSKRRNFHTRNIAVACIDSVNADEWEGRVYTKYSAEPICFKSAMAMLMQLDAFYDSINYPESSTKNRMFREVPDSYKIENSEPVKDEDFLLEKKGDMATFYIFVQYRQNATWQGEIDNPETDEIRAFESEMDLLKLIDEYIN